MLSVSLTVLIIVAAILFAWFRSQMVKGYYELTRAAMGNTDAVFSRSIADAKKYDYGMVCVSRRRQPAS